MAKMGLYVPACEKRFPSLLLTASYRDSCHAVLTACATMRLGKETEQPMVGPLYFFLYSTPKGSL